jgi:hypothetical protein
MSLQSKLIMGVVGLVALGGAVFYLAGVGDQVQPDRAEVRIELPNAIK